MLNTKSPFRLWSPQQWAQHINDEDGTTAMISAKHVTITSKKRNFTKTARLDKKANVGFIRSAPGYKKYAQCAIQCEPCAMPAIIPFEESEIGTTEVDISQLPTQESVPTPTKTQEIHKAKAYGTTEEIQASTPTVIEFHDETIPTNNDEEEFSDPQQELLKWHMRLGHLPFGKLQQLATQNVIPKRLANCKTPMCIGCIYRKATRRSWRDKAVPWNTGGTNIIRRPGDCVSIDQLESPTPGFIGQIKGWLMTDRYTAATVFVDHFSDC